MTEFELVMITAIVNTETGLQKDRGSNPVNTIRFLFQITLCHKKKNNITIVPGYITLQ